MIRPLILKILEDVEPEIMNEMLKRDISDPDLEMWQLLPDPSNTILNWDKLKRIIKSNKVYED